MAVPLKDSLLVPFSTNFSTRLTATPVPFGFSAAQASTLATLVGAYSDAYAAMTEARSAGNRSKTLTDAKDSAKAALLPTLRAYYQQVQGSVVVADADKTLLGVAIRSILAAVAARPRLGAPPRPAPLDLDFEREAQERPDHDDERKHGKVLERGRHRDRADDVRRDQELEAEQDPTSEIGPIALEGRRPADGRESAIDEGDGGCGRADDDDCDPRDLDPGRDPFEDRVDRLTSRPRAGRSVGHPIGHRVGQCGKAEAGFRDPVEHGASRAEGTTNPPEVGSRTGAVG